VTVAGGRGVSRADPGLRRVKIGTNDGLDTSACEHACLHELAHIVTAERSPGNDLREPPAGRGSSKGHHHAWRANFVFIVSKTLDLFFGRHSFVLAPVVGGTHLVDEEVFSGAVAEAVLAEHRVALEAITKLEPKH
jgi:hypothetical protein